MVTKRPRKRIVKRWQTKLPSKRINRRKLKFRALSRRTRRAIQATLRAAQRGKTHRPTASIVFEDRSPGWGEDRVVFS